MSVVQAVVLGILQGVTEFLPVSSSGHLAILEHIWSLPEAQRLPLTTMLHLGTAVAVLVFFWRRIVGILAGCFSGDPGRNGPSRHTIGYVILGSVPAAAVGLLLNDRIDAAFSSPALVAALLLVTGAMLFGTRFVPVREGRPGWARALLVGLAQAVAILPGISRSGATISAGLYSGMGREESFEFSFLLAVPAILGASLLELRKVDLAAVSPASVGLGTLVALVSGLAALYLLRRIVVSRQLYLFAFYCWLVGILGLVFVR